MRWLERILWLLVAALVGVGIGLAAFRPWQPRTSPVVAIASPSTPASAAGLPTATPNATCPNVAVQKTEIGTIPRLAWVHASDGVNVRSAPSTSANRVTTFPVGFQVDVRGEQKNPDGSAWYQVLLADGGSGWLSEQFVTNYPIDKAVTDNFTIWLPRGYLPRSAGTGVVESRWDATSLDFMFVQSAAAGQGSTLRQVPAGLPARSSWQPDHRVQVLVGDHPAGDDIFRVNVGKCPVLVHEIHLSTAARDYDFFFITDQNTAGVVTEVLDSASVR
jgi:hypothetical protein